jgi:hypothetical protein
MAKNIGDGDAADFDETRRLLYMALYAPLTKRYNLVGTLVNALVHHHAVTALAPDAVANHIIAWLEQDHPGDTAGSDQFLREQIDCITAELGD